MPASDEQDQPRPFPLKKIARIALKAAIILVLAANVLLLTSVAKDKRAIRATATALAAPGTNEGEVVRRLARFVRDEVHHCTRAEVTALPALQRWNYLYNPFRIGPKTVLDSGGDHTGACGSSSRVLMELLSAHDIDSRFIIIKGSSETHTVLEVFYDGAWGAVDPLYNIVYADLEGRPASLHTLRRDEESFLRNAKEGWQYGSGPDRREQVSPYNTDKYPFRDAHYFNFDKFGVLSQGLYRMLRTAFGEEATFWVKRPNFYAYPALTTAVLLDGFVGTVGLTWLGTRALLRRRRRRTRVNNPNNS